MGVREDRQEPLLCNTLQHTATQQSLEKEMTINKQTTNKHSEKNNNKPTTVTYLF